MVNFQEILIKNDIFDTMLTFYIMMQIFFDKFRFLKKVQHNSKDFKKSKKQWVEKIALNSNKDIEKWREFRAIRNQVNKMNKKLKHSYYSSRLNKPFNCVNDQKGTNGSSKNG